MLMRLWMALIRRCYYCNAPKPRHKFSCRLCTGAPVRELHVHVWRQNVAWSHLLRCDGCGEDREKIH